MSHDKRIKIGLAGNPNSGKSLLFNFLTGLNQKVSNFPGVTVDKKVGTYRADQGYVYDVIDLPGTYSTFPNSIEEKIVINILMNKENSHFPDLLIYVADVTQLEKHLLFASQLRDLHIPMIFVLNMIDLIDNKAEQIHTKSLEDFLQCQVVQVSIRHSINLDELKEKINQFSFEDNVVSKKPEHIDFLSNEIIKDDIYAIHKSLQTSNIYLAKLLAHHHKWLDYLTEDERSKVKKILADSSFEDLKEQVTEVMSRYATHAEIVSKTIFRTKVTKKSFTEVLDGWLTHRVLGPLIFITVMLFVFQAIFNWASYPMDKIEEGFVWISESLGNNLQETWLTGMLVHGLIPGLAGVLVFIPQIAILFFLIAILEESGYMSRVVYMFDGLLQKFGMNGRSMVALISSGACAIPAIMSTRTISNPKERLITILVSPLISCSARLPVYAVLIGFVVPADVVLGFLNLQGLVFMGLYLLGIAAALISGLIFKHLIKSDAPSFLMIELPKYKPPVWSNVFMMVKTKVLSFVMGAGKIIIVISMVLYFLASFGPKDSFGKAAMKAAMVADSLGLNQDERDNLMASMKLETSYIGHAGKLIEPSIAPLGFDWKIGIALLTSFAAREVFVGTMATIYSLGSNSDEKTIREKMADDVRLETGQKVYDRSTAISLLVFYVFAMQCMSTMAITKKETNTWKWPIYQFVFMGILAYMGAFIAYRIF